MPRAFFGPVAGTNREVKMKGLFEGGLQAGRDGDPVIQRLRAIASELDPSERWAIVSERNEESPNWFTAEFRNYERLPLFSPVSGWGTESLNQVGAIFEPFVRPDPLPSDPRPVLRDPFDEEPGNIENLAWYRTWRGSGWGIFIRVEGIKTVARAMTPPGQPVSRQTLVHAYEKLYLHEYCHFLIDVAIAGLEQTVGRDLYWAHRDTYVGRGFRGYHELSEALCNAFAYRNLKAPHRRWPLKKWMKRGPEGYREFGDYLHADAFYRGIEELLAEVLWGQSHGANQGLLAARGLFQDRRGDLVSPANVPVYLVPQPSGASGPVLFDILSLPSLSLTNKFVRMMDKLPPEVGSDWRQRVEPALRTDTRSAPKFKRLKGRPPRFSVRVAQDYRAILCPVGDGHWQALEIGRRDKVYK